VQAAPRIREAGRARGRQGREGGPAPGRFSWIYGREVPWSSPRRACQSSVDGGAVPVKRCQVVTQVPIACCLAAESEAAHV